MKNPKLPQYTKKHHQPSTHSPKMDMSFLCIKLPFDGNARLFWAVLSFLNYHLHHDKTINHCAYTLMF